MELENKLQAGATGPAGSTGPAGATGPAGVDGSDATNYWTESGGNVYRSSGNVGIGTTYPFATLEVNGTARITALAGPYNTGDRMVVADSDGDLSTKDIYNGSNVGDMKYWNGSAWEIIPVPTNLRSGSGSGDYGTLLLIEGVPRWVQQIGQGNNTYNSPPYLGQPYLGGVVAYILQSGDPGYDANVKHGLIATPTDQTNTVASGGSLTGGVEWGCMNTVISGASGIAIGTGNQNTVNIEAGCTVSGTAADICANLVYNGFSDWYLPSIDELAKLYINRLIIGGFNNFDYWSSTQSASYPAVGALALDFSDGSVGGKVKTGYQKGVRAIKSF